MLCSRRLLGLTKLLGRLLVHQYQSSAFLSKGYSLLRSPPLMRSVCCYCWDIVAGPMTPPRSKKSTGWWIRSCTFVRSITYQQTKKDGSSRIEPVRVRMWTVHLCTRIGRARLGEGVPLIFSRSVLDFCHFPISSVVHTSEEGKHSSRSGRRPRRRATVAPTRDAHSEKRSFARPSCHPYPPNPNLCSQLYLHAQ